jgi:DNA-binding phage protein
MYNILSLKEIKEKLQDRRLSVVAKSTGLSYPTLKRMLDDDSDANYTLSTLTKISEYFK